MADQQGFLEHWNREDGPIGNGWRSASEDHANWWDPMVLYRGAPVNANPDQGLIGQPNNAAGRAAAYKNFGSGYADSFQMGTWWNGKHQAVGGPVACINLDDRDWGLAFVYEPQIYGGTYVLWALGRQPHEVRVLKGAPGGLHIDGTPVYFAVRVSGGSITCYADGRQILVTEIPAALAGSTTHGICLDVNPVPGRPPNVEVIKGPFEIAPLSK